MKKLIIGLIELLSLSLLAIFIAIILVIIYSYFLSAMPFLAVFVGIVIYVGFVVIYFSN